MGRVELHKGFCCGTLSERDHLEDPGGDGRIILRRIFRKWDAWNMDWIDLAQVRNRWCVPVNAVVNLRVL
jgi:hypothetical protein